MPIYEYECSKCNHRLDLLQKIGDEPVKECPECHQDALVRLVSAAGFQLKGQGWYVTDFKDKNSKKSNTDSSTQVSSSATNNSDKKTQESSSMNSNQKKKEGG